MIKAMVVDDERLVRKGFISLIDWPSFGVVIVGEAGDGAGALAMLEEQEADLLFVDITMPGMTGFELIRQVRRRFPGIRCVVLTCHHEFDYVQEALRLGAVDYIVKTLLEADNAGETISRLVGRIEWERCAGTLPAGGGDAGVFAVDSALAYVPVILPGSEEELLRLDAVRNRRLLALRSMWIAPLPGLCAAGEGQREQHAAPAGRWQTALVTGLKGRRVPEVEELLEQCLRPALFYAGDGSRLPVSLACGDLRQLAGSAVPPGTSPAREGEGPLEQAANLRWTLEGAEWDKFTAAVLARRIPAGEIQAFGAGLISSWQGYLLRPEEAARLQAEAEAALDWCRWQSWLRQFAGYVQRRSYELGLSKEVLLCLIRAVRYMRRHAGDKINQSDVAAHVSMSRGYFSQCFARFAGESFGECLRGMRLTLAKTLLLTTNIPVCEIACRSGFEDDRYFSRLFREHVGSLPSEYRAEGIGS
ncbi:response regulator transcription factor [Paenibacillus tengchongensis]|uniref:response regulator transcription factor n=1 Tax=Paenibacillus tengchongensis TaxID=2608684 RepID=UPI00124CF97E|nr:response regulator [Paenibacillus tengchongensis]